jgi:hypothetical protein
MRSVRPAAANAWNSRSALVELDDDVRRAGETAVTFQYVGVEEAIKRPGLRMVVVGDVPSPWGEAAKGILHIKGIEWVAVRLSYDNEALKEWAGQRSGPVAIYNNERPRSGWAEILRLAERLAPTPSLLPANPAERALVFGLAHEICGEDGLSWSRRLQLVHAGLQHAGGFPEPVSKYLGRKYGYSPAAGAARRRGWRTCCACWSPACKPKLRPGAATMSVTL